MAFQARKDSTCWFVGAMYGRDDQLPRFLEQGIWETGDPKKFGDVVKEMEVGDRIAVKAAYTRKNGLPFDNRGHDVSVMGIKAIGVITDNPGTGKQVKVKWQKVDPVREWYLFTSRNAIWRVEPDGWYREGLIAFTFENREQDIARYCNEPYWADRFGGASVADRRFVWTSFYEEMATRLLDYAARRDELVAFLHQLADKHNALTTLDDQLADGTTGPLQDICPFTVMGTFNRGINDVNRKAIAADLAQFLGVTLPVPDSYEGIPVLNNMSSRFFWHQYERGDDDINKLWHIFADAIRYAEAQDGAIRDDFIRSFDAANEVNGVKWNLTMGLYWVRPWFYPPLDQNSREYLKTLAMPIKSNMVSALEYLTLQEDLNDRFNEADFPAHSFPELSLNAWKTGNQLAAQNVVPSGNPVSVQTYSLQTILNEGCFLPSERLAAMLDRLRSKKNLILQGPPGTGKTWLAKRLGYALIGAQDRARVRAVQFHPNLSYEDFVHGYRPAGNGKLELVEGPFLEVVRQALNEPDRDFVVVIEEINRGQPAQILGEMLTLLEADKRTASEALHLSYQRSSDSPVHIPPNLYVIGTMNVADRSLALVDMALRRRFAFVDLEPAIGEPWRAWMRSCGIAPATIADIEARIMALNNEIASDPALGPQYRIGHSFVTPTQGTKLEDARAWFKQVVETEIGPLLNEYWFDDRAKAQRARERLLAGI